MFSDVSLINDCTAFASLIELLDKSNVCNCVKVFIASRLLILFELSFKFVNDVSELISLILDIVLVPKSRSVKFVRLDNLEISVIEFPDKFKDVRPVSFSIPDKFDIEHLLKSSCVIVGIESVAILKVLVSSLLLIIADEDILVFKFLYKLSSSKVMSVVGVVAALTIIPP